MGNDDQSMWCCSVFKDSVARRGESDIAVAVGRDQKLGLYFALEFRAVSAQDEAEFTNVSPVRVRINMAQAIRFCPWCGTGLRDFYADKSDQLPVHDEILLDRPM